MRIGVFGGTFDPPHLGHLRLAESCRQQARLNCVRFVPAAQQPHKPGGAVASGEDRLTMVQLAIQHEPAFTASRIELDRGGISYTADTLRSMKAEEPAAEFFFLMGADSLIDFPSWREPEVICDLATPLVVQRAGLPRPDLSLLMPIASQSRMAQIRSLPIEMPAMAISSSEIRRSIAIGGEWRQFVPSPVARYIDARRLYR